MSEIDVNHNQVTFAAVEAQETNRELSRLEATVIAQYLCGNETKDLWWDVYYKPRSVYSLIIGYMDNQYTNANWAEKVAWDMLGTYCLNTSDI